MIKTILRSFFFAIFLVLIIGALLSPNYQVSEKITINAPISDVTPWLNDLSHWPNWAPWEYYHSNRDIKVTQPSQGIGAHISWQEKTGLGELTILGISETPNLFTLDYTSTEQQALLTGQFFAEQRNLKTELTWHVSGGARLAFFGGYLRIWQQKRMQAQLKLGLKNLKNAVEINQVVASEQ